MGQVLIVVVLAAGAGFLVYRISLRWGVERPAAHGLPGAGFAVESETRPAHTTQRTSTVAAQVAAPVASKPLEQPQGAYLYVPLAPGRRSWQTRVFGLVGLVIVVAVASAVLAFSLYQGGHLLNKGMKGYFDSGSPTTAPHATP